ETAQTSPMKIRTNSRIAGSRLLLACAALLALISACETTDLGSYRGGQAEARAAALARGGQHAESASLYISLASGASGTERDRLTLLATEQWLDAGDGRRAMSAMQSVAKPAEGDLLLLWTTN